MKAEDLAGLSRWFAAFVENERALTAIDPRPMDLKARHTARVRQEILGIGKAMGLSCNALLLAEAAALLHDVGRFRQYRLHGTFSDARSVDHARLSEQVIREEGILDGLLPREKTIILEAVRLHNRREVSGDLDPEALLHVRLLRDADKLDIYQVFTRIYSGQDAPDPVLVHLLPEDSKISPEVVQRLADRRIVPFEYVKNVNDYKLFQVGWIFDVNFPPTWAAIRERGYIQIIFDSLPSSGELSELRQSILAFLDERAGQQEGAIGNTCPFDG
ncbi:MAG: HD domain-containing protein [Deltaproteobacteria bacterium]